jgi:hypothetical protein
MKEKLQFFGLYLIEGNNSIINTLCFQFPAGNLNPIKRIRGSV